MKRFCFIGILIEDELGQQIDLIRKRASTEYHSFKSLNSPPHITLIPPFHIESDIEVFWLELSERLASEKVFEIRLLNFGSFRPRTIFIGVENNKRLDELQKRLSELVSGEVGVKRQLKKQFLFKPHLTLLNRDLTLENFNKAWEKYKKTSFQGRFKCCKISLLEHDEKQWNVLKELYLVD